jgi:tRNA(Ile)-lysidine synthase
MFFDIELISQSTLRELAPSFARLVAVASLGPIPPPLSISSKCDNTASSVILSSRAKGMISRVLESIRRYQLLEGGDRVIVALSGGPDSVALLLALKELEESLSLQVSAAHMNHLLRGEESDEDERFVCRLCQQAGVPIEVQRMDTQQEVERSGENLQSCARRLRYQFFFQLALSENCRVATGHTLNDQAETFLMKLIRGAGPAGLSGIAPVRVIRFGRGPQPRGVRVVRPLLELSRPEILTYLKETKRSYREDRSNQDLSYHRNWVRHQLIPLVENKLNPSLIETLSRSSELFKEIEEYLLAHGKEAFEQCRIRQEGEIRIRIEELKRFPAIIQKQVVRQGVVREKGDLHDITLKHIADVLELCAAGSGREIHLPGGLKVQREFEELRFTRESSPCDFWYQLSVPGEILIKEVGKSVVARRVRAGGKGKTLIKWGDNDLIVRNRRPGDEYRVSPRSGTRKLKELLQRKRIPRSQRDKLLILEGNNEIMWVEGFPPHPNYRISEEDPAAVEIEVHAETPSR